MPTSTMKAAILHGADDMRVQAWARPEPGPGEVLLKVEVASICGTDVKVLHRTLQGQPAGEFVMGSPTTEKDRFDNETPHRVKISWTRLDPGDGLDSAVGDGFDETVVVVLVLVGVAGGEVGDGAIHGAVGAEVFGDGDGVPRSGVGAGKSPAAHPGVEPHTEG